MSPQSGEVKQWQLPRGFDLKKEATHKLCSRYSCFQGAVSLNKIFCFKGGRRSLTGLSSVKRTLFQSRELGLQQIICLKFFFDLFQPRREDKPVCSAFISIKFVLLSTEGFFCELGYERIQGYRTRAQTVEIRFFIKESETVSR